MKRSIYTFTIIAACMAQVTAARAMDISQAQDLLDRNLAYTCKIEADDAFVKGYKSTPDGFVQLRRTTSDGFTGTFDVTADSASARYDIGYSSFYVSQGVAWLKFNLTSPSETRGELPDGAIWPSMSGELSLEDNHPAQLRGTLNDSYGNAVHIDCTQH